MKDADNLQADWEAMFWFLLAHNLKISDAHERRADELKSTIETIDGDLAAQAETFVALTREKTALHLKGDTSANPRLPLLLKELDRATVKFKERVNRLSA